MFRERAGVTPDIECNLCVISVTSALSLKIMERFQLENVTRSISMKSTDSRQLGVIPNFSTVDA